MGLSPEQFCIEIEHNTYKEIKYWVVVPKKDKTTAEHDLQQFLKKNCPDISAWAIRKSKYDNTYNVYDFRKTKEIGLTDANKCFIKATSDYEYMQQSEILIQ